MYEKMGSFFYERVEGRGEGIRAMIPDKLKNGSSREQMRKN